MSRPRTASARPSSRVRPALAALVLALLAAALVPAVAGAAPMYWGATIKGDVWGIPGEAPTSPEVMERFESDAGKHITFVNTGQAWGQFDTSTMEAAINAGVLPLVTMRLENATLKEVIEGKQDAVIENWARAAKAFAYPFLFRPWWEVNGTWYSWGRSPEYVEAWRHFYDIVVKKIGATNVTWDWVVNTIWPEDPHSDPTPWYPGNEYVDWVGIDAYNWGKNPIQPASWLTAEQSIQPTLSILDKVAPGKPVCICESASTEYDEEGQPPKPAKKAAWIHEMLDTYLPSHPEIKAYLWFDWNVEKEGGPVGERYDWPIESSPQAEEAFREGIANPDYLSQLPPLTPLAKVPMPVLPTVPSGEGVTPVGSPIVPPSGGQPSGGSTPTGAPGAVTPAPTPAPSVPVAFGAPHPQAALGTANLPLWVPGSGTIQVSARGARVSIIAAGGRTTDGTSRTIPGTERLMLHVSAVGRKRRALLAGGQAQVTVTVSFTPTGGTPMVQSRQLALPPHS